MGAGASASSIEAELAKPADASDLSGADAAKAEVQRLRGLIRSAPQPQWTLGYGAYKSIGFENEVAASNARDPLVLRMCDQMIKTVATGIGPARVTILGANTPTSEGYPKHEVDKSSLRVLEHFSNKSDFDAAALHTVAMPPEEGAPAPTSTTTIAEGPMWYVCKNGTRSTPTYTIVGTQSAKSKEGVEGLIAAHKKVALEQIDFEEGAIAYAIMPPVGGDGDVVLRNIAWFASDAAHELHKARKDPERIAVAKPLMEHIDFTATDVEEAGMREFGNAAHLESEGLRKGKGKGVSAIFGFGEEE